MGSRRGCGVGGGRGSWKGGRGGGGGGRCVEKAVSASFLEGCGRASDLPVGWAPAPASLPPPSNPHPASPIGWAQAEPEGKGAQGPAPAAWGRAGGMGGGRIGAVGQAEDVQLGGVGWRRSLRRPLCPFWKVLFPSLLPLHPSAQASPAPCEAPGSRRGRGLTLTLLFLCRGHSPLLLWPHRLSLALRQASVERWPHPALSGLSLPICRMTHLDEGRSFQTFIKKPWNIFAETG